MREELEGALAGAKIRLMQREVGVNDAHERDVREMQALRYHLCADKNVGLAHTKIAEDFPVIVLAFHGVGIHAFDARMWKKFGERFLDPLRACAGKTNCGVFAFLVRAHRWHALHVAANVAAKFLFLPMKREREAAIRTLRDVAAFGALERGRITAPVQKQNRLLVLFKPLCDGFLELR